MLERRRRLVKRGVRREGVRREFLVISTMPVHRQESGQNRSLTPRDQMLGPGAVTLRGLESDGEAAKSVEVGDHINQHDSLALDHEGERDPQSAV